MSRCSRSLSSTTIVMSIKRVEEIAQGTESWIQKVVIGMGLCPFAAKHAYSIHVNTDKTMAKQQAFILQHANEMVKEAHNNKNGEDESPQYRTRLLVFPDKDENSEQKQLLNGAVKMSQGIIGSNLTDIDFEEQMQLLTIQANDAVKSGAVNPSNMHQFIEECMQKILSLTPRENSSPILLVPFSPLFCVNMVPR